MQIKAAGIFCFLAVAGIWAFGYAQTSAPRVPPHQWVAIPAEA